MAFINSASPFAIHLFEQFFKIWKWCEAGDANDTPYFGHFWNFGQYSYFSKQCKFPTVRYALWPSHLKVVFGNCRNSIFLINKLFKTSDICIFLCPKKSRTDCRKTIVGRRKMHHPSFNIICTVYRFKYKTPSHFNDLVLAWTAYLKYLVSRSWITAFRSIKTWFSLINHRRIFLENLLVNLLL